MFTLRNVHNSDGEAGDDVGQKVLLHVVVWKPLHHRDSVVHELLGAEV